MNSFIADYFRRSLTKEDEFKLYISCAFERFNQLVKRGEELSPLSLDTDKSESFGLEKFIDETFLLKSRLAFHVFSSIVKKSETLP